MIELSGIPVYKSIEIAPVIVHKETELKITISKIEPKQVEEELSRFENIHKQGITELKELKEKAENANQHEEIEILKAHLMMADDLMMINKIKSRIKNEYSSLEQAIEDTKAEFMEMFSAIEDDYLKARAADIEDVTNRFLKIALGIREKGFDDIQEDVILAAKDLKPSELTGITAFIKGILLEEGSQTSHVAIIAKAKGIPTIVSLSGLLDTITPGSLVILDSVQNKVFIHPTEEKLLSYKKQKEDLFIKREKLSRLKEEEAITKDGRKIKLYGNIGDTSEAEYVAGCGGKGIGLFRTEFLYMNAEQFPSEEEQFIAYKITAEAGLEDVIIRTLDIGGDKVLPYYQFKEEANPFLGFRALRFTLANTELFKTQLRAILRASAFGKISIMFPMVSSLEEVLQVKALLKTCREELEQEHTAFDPDIRIGIMIEIPSAAATSDILIEEVDFFSIGTNDLCQYTLAVDRMNKEVAYLYQPLHPSILRLIKQTVEAAHREQKEAGICGEMAGEASHALILIGLGIDELSMSPALIPEIKAFIRQLTYEDTKRVAGKALKLKTSQDIKALLDQEVKKYDY